MPRLQDILPGALLQQIDRGFPGLLASPHDVKSPRTDRYNCIAWAVGDSQNWWDPTKREGYWPAGVARSLTVDAYIDAFGSVGFTPCDLDDKEPGYSRIALYILNGRPTHASRQMDDVRWTSKLGRFFDLEHSFDALNGPQYGAPEVILRRPEG